MPDRIKLELRGHNHPFAYLVIENSTNSANNSNNRDITSPVSAVISSDHDELLVQP
jgi:hypothetical protein